MPILSPLPSFPRTAGLSDGSVLLLRAFTGAFLVNGTLDNVFSAARMDEFAAFLTQQGFAYPQLMAPLSVWAQFLCGLLLVAGLFTRAAGLIIAFNFIVAVAMVHWGQDLRDVWPAAILVLLGLFFATSGGGRFSADEYLRRQVETGIGGRGGSSNSRDALNQESATLEDETDFPTEGEAGRWDDEGAPEAEPVDLPDKIAARRPGLY